MLKTSGVKIGLIGLLAIGLFACTPVSYKDNDDSNWSNLSEVKVAVYGGIWKELASNFELPDGDHPEVQAEIRRFKAHPEYLQESLRHSAPYIYYIFQQTKQRNLPAELALIPIIESGYDPFKCSHVGANGLWQFMPGTASGFGLKMNWWYDGRRDIAGSTRAALRHLTYLHDYFNNDWLLALAAYNAGEGRVHAADKHGGDNQDEGSDFWSIHLPSQTRAYVPRLLAIAEIIRNPSKYGIELPPVSDSPYLQEVDVGGQIDVNLAAEFAGVTPETLRKLNPGLRRFATDPDGPYTLLVPIDNASNFALKVAQLNLHSHYVWREHVVKPGETLSLLAKKYKINSALVVQANRLPNKQIRQGQTLVLPYPVAPAVVAKQADSSDMDESKAPLIAVNSAEHSSSAKSDEDTAEPANASDADADAATDQDEDAQGDEAVVDSKIWTRLTKIAPEATRGVVAEEKLPGPQKVTYSVRPGETLVGIGHKYHVTPHQIAAWNQLQDGASLTAKQELIVWVKAHHLASKSGKKSGKRTQVTVNKSVNAPMSSPKTLPRTSNKKSLAAKSMPKTYQVAAGDSLLRIARRFQVSVADLKAANHLTTDTVKIGAVLTLPSGHLI